MAKNPEMSGVHLDFMRDPVRVYRLMHHDAHLKTDEEIRAIIASYPDPRTPQEPLFPRNTGEEKKK